MNKKDINNKIRSIAIDRFAINKEDATDNSRFKEDMGADSLDIIEFFMALETEFSTTIPDVDYKDLYTIGEVTEYLHERQSFV